MSEETSHRSTQSISSIIQRRPFRIELRGQVDMGWMAAFDPISFSSSDRVTIFKVLADQSALRGVLNHLWDLNLDVLSVVEIAEPVVRNGGIEMQKYVYTFEELPSNIQPLAGGKGGALAKLFQAGYPVPAGFVIFASAFSEDRLKPEAWSQILAQLDRLRAGNNKQAFAIRSSALSEDSEQASFAGEFESRLNLSSDEQIQDAIHQVHCSRHAEKVHAYSRARGMTAAHEVAVVVQRLVAADRSGVLFTANPTNGIRTQVMINAAWGLGEAIVSGAVTPDMVIVDKNAKRIVSRHTATKEVMTVRIADGTQDRPLEGRKQKQAVLSDGEAVRLTNLSVQIETLFGIPMDIEWAASGTEFYILQARPITAIPDPPPPSIWKLPKGAYVAMRVNIIELMAEPLSPLFETLGLDAINTSMQAMMTSFLGPGIMPERPIISINHYAYYNGSLKPMKIARLLFDSIGIAKRMFTAPVERWTEQGRPEYLAVVEKWKACNWRDFSKTEILRASRELAGAAVDAYWSMVGGLLPAAWISEALFTYFYRLLIKRRADPAAPTYLLGFDSVPILADKSLYTLATWARGQEPLERYLAFTPASQLAADLKSGQPPEGLSEIAWREWRQKVQTYLEQYGHTIYNLDFANPIPVDDPTTLLDTFKLYLSGKGSNPNDRQQAAIDRRQAAISATRKRLKGWRLKQFERWLALAQRFAPLREDALADVGLAYPLLREMLQYLGDQLTQAGAIQHPEDIYWLTLEEVASACENLDHDLPVERISMAIPERKAALRSAQKATPPIKLPQLSLPWLSNLFTDLSRNREHRSLKGVAASAGSVTGRACVLHGPEDFAQMASGDILVARLTTPAWTPLFARASAIVTDVGGPLSHGSIVAREYGIPAVLGTGVATKRIQNGQTITVDGTAGVVILGENGGSAQ
jgi:rifampicin phosphotransferase